MKRKDIGKKEVVNAIQKCAKDLRRNPKARDLQTLAGISRDIVAARWGSLAQALRAAGLKPVGMGLRQTDSSLLLDWARTARRLKKLPSINEYTRQGRFTLQPFATRYKGWRGVPKAFAGFARAQRIEAEWKDVLALKEPDPRGRKWRAPRSGAILRNAPLYGAPIGLPEMAFAPTNEGGVMFAFGALARRLGFKILRSQYAFPDVEAMREVAPGVWQRVRIELEFESRNFKMHRHRKEGCDLIVCWVNNWPECPVEVIELSKVVEEMYGKEEGK
ncbi:MAG TPA: hypothetical protein VFR84_01830 [Candidatus Angelobacter sp.]|nr:hypothetical protein [Candidatus Angelobacter sp.]